MIIIRGLTLFQYGAMFDVACFNEQIIRENHEKLRKVQRHAQALLWEQNIWYFIVVSARKLPSDDACGISWETSL